MSSHRLVIELDVEFIDPSWTEQELLDNAPLFLATVIDRAQAEESSVQPYRFDTDDLTVWTQSGYFEDHAAAAWHHRP